MRFALGIWAAFIVTACPYAAYAASGRITIESSGVTRTAILVEHARLKKTRRPVVIVLHSGGSGAVRVRHTLGLEDKARSASPVMVYPEAISGHWSDAGKPGDNRDTIFIHDLVGKLIAEGIADRRRIFLVGGSSGGMVALKLACSGSEDFAGIVAIFAGLPADLAASCKLARPIPFLLLAGTADPYAPYNGGIANLPDSNAELLSASATLNLFAKAANCGEGVTTTAFLDRQIEPSRAFLDKRMGCKVPVELLRIEGGGHRLPRTGPVGMGIRVIDGDPVGSPGLRNRDVDAPSLIWDFLRHAGA